MHTIFLVHGMGNFTQGWSAQIQADIRKYYDREQYAFLADFPFDTHFTFAEITYNELFTEYLKEAKDHAASLVKWNKLTAGLTGDALGILQKVVSAASSAPADNFLVNYLADVAFYMATDIGQEIKSDIVVQMNKALGGANYDPAKNSWSVVAHSLGTRVMTEVLQAGFTAAPSLKSYGKAQVFMQVANVSKLLQDILKVPYNPGDVYHCAVYPSDTAANGVCNHFINATHRLDPFAFIDEFDPKADFGDGSALINGLYHPVRLAASDITAWEVHALEHYMRHPAVHTTLFQYLQSGLNMDGPTTDEMETEMSAYHKQTITSQVQDAFKTELAALPTNPFSTIAQIFALWQKYGALVARYKRQL